MVKHEKKGGLKVMGASLGKEPMKGHKLEDGKLTKHHGGKHHGAKHHGGKKR
jgi:hypothetical protein